MPLYTYANETLAADDFLKALHRVGVRAGDTIFVHSRISAFGKPACGKAALLCSLSAALKKSVGASGTVIMPTFTYSFCNGEPYDTGKSPSTVGVLTEHFRREKGVARTHHPLFSVAVWGKKKAKFSRVGSDSFGEDSIFGLLRAGGGKIVFLGAPLHSLTFLHYIEQKKGVPYRYMKTFTGTTHESGKKRKDSSTYFVRDLKRDVETDLTRFERRLREKKLLHEARVGGGAILSVDARQCFAEGMRMLDKDIYAFLKKKPR